MSEHPEHVVLLTLTVTDAAELMRVLQLARHDRLVASDVAGAHVLTELRGAVAFALADAVCGPRRNTRGAR